MVYVFVKIAVTVTIIAIASYANIEAIKAIMPDLMAESYIAMASGVIALIALLFAIIQGWQNQKHNRLSVKPFLITFTASGIDKNLRSTNLRIDNRGVGPAIIKNIVLFYKGKEVARNNHNDYNNFMQEKLKYFTDPHGGFFFSGNIIQAGEKRIIYEFKYDPLTQNTAFLNEIELLIEYQSIYEDEIFTLDSRETRRLAEKTTL